MVAVTRLSESHEGTCTPENLSEVGMQCTSRPGLVLHLALLLARDLRSEAISASIRLGTGLLSAAAMLFRP